MKVSICIPCHNQGHLIHEALTSCVIQDYEDLEIIVLDDASDEPINETDQNIHGRIKYFRSDAPSGTGGSFNKAMSYATGDIIVLLCSDDVFTCPQVISDYVKVFKSCPEVVHVSRWYHQFIHGDRRPVRAWRGNDVIELANNPSGLAFRKSAIEGCQLSNKMFVEASSLVDAMIKSENNGILKISVIIEYDTVAVRIHQSISRSKDYYLKRWNSSPVEEWSKVGGKALLNDFTSLIQIKNYFVTSAVLKECWNFIKLRPLNLINPAFIFFALVSILTPRFILKHVPHWYRVTWGRWTTREMKRP